MNYAFEGISFISLLAKIAIVWRGRLCLDFKREAGKRDTCLCYIRKSKEMLAKQIID